MRVPNIQRVHAVVNGRRTWLNVCTRCIKAGRVTKAA
jgi:large subunit ribosomal protein L28